MHKSHSQIISFSTYKGRATVREGRRTRKTDIRRAHESTEKNVVQKNVREVRFGGVKGKSNQKYHKESNKENIPLALE